MKKKIIKTEIIEMSVDEAEHLLSCLANQKYIKEVNADGMSEGVDSVRSIQAENQRAIDKAYKEFADVIYGKPNQE